MRRYFPFLNSENRLRREKSNKLFIVASWSSVFFPHRPPTAQVYFMIVVHKNVGNIIMKNELFPRILVIDNYLIFFIKLLFLDQSSLK